jgi:Retrotransposon gag protein
LDSQSQDLIIQLNARLQSTQEQVQELRQTVLTSSTMVNSSSSTSTPTSAIDTNEYPKGFKFVLPKPFKGDQQELESWLFNIEEYFHNTNLTEDKWLRVAISDMTGNATLWWRMRINRQDQPQDWPNFKTEIRRQFLPKNVLRAAQHQLENLKQLKSVTQYNADFAAAMIEVVNLSDAEALSLYMRGLKSQTYDYVDLEEPDKLYDAMKIAEKFDVIKFGQNVRNSKSNFKRPRLDRYQPARNDNHKELDTMNRRNFDRDRDKKEHRCYRCHKRGHIGVNCLKFPGPLIPKTTLSRPENDRRQ